MKDSSSVQTFVEIAISSADFLTTVLKVSMKKILSYYGCNLSRPARNARYCWFVSAWKEVFDACRSDLKYLLWGWNALLLLWPDLRQRYWWDPWFYTGYIHCALAGTDSFYLLRFNLQTGKKSSRNGRKRYQPLKKTMKMLRAKRTVLSLREIVSSVSVITGTIRSSHR